MLRFPFRFLLAPAIIGMASPILWAEPGFLRPSYDLNRPPDSSTDSAVARFVGGTAGDGLGRIIRTGDVNGDDRDDLIIATDTGKIHVWLGSPNFAGSFDVTGTFGHGPQVTITGFDTLRALAVGDVDANGIDDIILGFTPTANGSGNAAIILGRSSFGSPTSLNVEFQGSEGASVLIQPGAADDDLTRDGALAVGDVNGDGKADIILGAPNANLRGYPGAGAAYVLLGRNVFPNGIALSSSVNNGPSFTVVGASTGDGLTAGGALHTADVNGDGKADIIVGSPNADGPADSRSGSGEVYVILGRANFSPGAQLEVVLQNNQGANLTLYGARPGDALTQGGKITSGDVNGDGIQDIIVSAPQAGGPMHERPDAGQAYVVLGRSTAFPASLDMLYSGSKAADSTLWGADLIIYGSDAGFGLTRGGILAAGDVNGDGLADLITGTDLAPNPLNNAEAAGQLYVVLGRRNLADVPALIDTKPDSATTHDFMIQGAREDDHLAKDGALLTGDLDGDGTADIIVGSSGATASGSGDRRKAGRVYVVPGRSSFPARVNLLDESGMNDGADAQLQGASFEDYLAEGGAMAMEDLNDDGDSDLILGAPKADGPADSRLNSGEVYVVNGVRRGEIAIRAPSGANVIDDGVVNLGQVGVGAGVPFTFTVKNTGRHHLYLGQPATNTPNSGLSLAAGQLPSFLPANGTGTFDLLLTASSVGSKSGVVFLSSSDQDENPFSFEVRLEVIKGTPPVVRTLPASPHVTLAGVGAFIDTKGYARRVFFDYGTTTSYGQTFEAESVPADFPKDEPRLGTLPSLLAHTRYYFRARATSIHGTGTGAYATFVTENSTPVAQNDVITVTDGGVIALDLLANDTDADNDALSIASFTQPKADGKAMGKVARSGNFLVLTVPANFSTAETEATFTYVAKDAFGGVSSAASVTFISGGATIDPPGVTKPSAGVTYPVAVTASGMWSINESVSWITASPRNDSPATLADITLLPNTSLNDRTATITIAGQPHEITQEGVVKPILTAPVDSGDPHLVGSPFSLSIGLQNAPVTFTTSSLPPGLTMNALGVISGTPTRGGSYPITIKARNAAGAADQVLNFTIVITPLHENFAGSYLGFVHNGDYLPSGQGARLELTTTKSGGVTGKLITNAATRPFTAQISSEVNDTDKPEVSISLPGATLFIQFDAAQQTFVCQLANGSGTGWRNGWNATTKPASAYRGLHTFSLVNASYTPAVPIGYGFGSFTVNQGTGALTVSGKLPDNSAFVTTGFIGQQGQVLIYQPLYAGKQGTFNGVLSVIAGATPEENSIGALPEHEPYWLKPTSLASARDTVYAGGFGPVLMQPEGGVYTPPAKGGVVMGLDNVNANAFVRLNYVQTSTQEFYGVSLRNPSANGLTNKATPVSPVANKFTMPTLNAATGAFGGTFSLTATPAAKTRAVTFYGQIVKAGATTQGFGYFLLPEFPDETGETVANTPKWSNRVTLEPGPIPE